MTPRIRSSDELLGYVEKVGECTLFPTQDYPDVYSHMDGETPEEKRTKAWSWADELHLEKRIFISLAIKGRETLTSWRYFKGVYSDRARQPLTSIEEDLLALIREKGALSTPELREASHQDRREFEKALKNLRRKMRLSIVKIRHESITKHIHVYDLTERWLPKTLV